MQRWTVFLFSYAFYLLAKRREPRACPYVICWLSLPEEQPFDIAGDIVTQDGDRILAAVCDGNLEPITSLIVNRESDEWGRSAGIAALTCSPRADQKTDRETEPNSEDENDLGKWLGGRDSNPDTVVQRAAHVLRYASVRAVSRHFSRHLFAPLRSALLRSRAACLNVSQPHKQDTGAANMRSPKDTVQSPS